MRKFNVADYDSNKNYIIEASAGTGKTYNIIEIVKKLVNEENKNLNEILIVTYTEKAAGELKDRIRKEITKENIDVDNAPIYTIHSFCQNTIKEFGLSANLPLDLKVLDENEIKKFVSRYVREGQILKDIMDVYKYTYVPDKQYSIEEIENTLVEGVKKYYLDNNNQEDKSVVSLKKINYDEYFNIIHAINCSKTFDELCLHNKDILDNYNMICKTDDSTLKSFITYIMNFSENKFNFSESEFKESAFVYATENEIKCFNYFKRIKHLLKTPPNHMLATKYIKDFYEKWQYEKSKNKSQTFDDMIRFVREAIVNDENFKNKLQDKYKIGIIDEFQDTNQKQFDIFQRIFIDENRQDHKIIVVGDPKQSIYSFQGADVNVYRKAVEVIKSNGEMCLLNKNYRSTKEMVEACNRLFKYYNFSNTTFNDSEYLSLEENDEYIHEVKYNGQKNKAFWIATDDDKKDIDEHQFAKIVAQKIIDCCTKTENDKTKLQIKRKKGNFENVSFKDFAVLVKTGSEITAIEKALKNVGIPFLRYKDKKLFLGKECADWIALLKALNISDYTGYNRKVLKKALFTNFFGVPLKVLSSEYFEKDDKKEIIMMNDWKVLVYKRHWEDLFDSIIIDSNLSLNLKTLKEIQSLAIYKQIGNYCIEYLSKGKSLDELIRNLINLSQHDTLEVDDENGTIVEKNTNFDCVQIMTMHASKGLQFPVVILFGGFKEPYTQGKAYTYHEFDKENNTEVQILSFERTKDYVEEENEEWKRLFYVAYTRAEFLLMLPYYKKYGTESSRQKSLAKPNEVNMPIEGEKCYKSKLKSYQKYLKELNEYNQRRNKNFLRTTTEELIKNDSDVYDFISYDKSITEEYLRNQTKEILNKKTVDTNGCKKQSEILKDMIKKCREKKIKKHSYSSLSHSGIHIEEVEDSELENKEGILHEGLSSFDKENKVVIPNYNNMINPIELSNDYPRGATLGTALHEIFEGLDFENYKHNLTDKIINCFLKQGIIVKEEWIVDTTKIVQNVMAAELPIINGALKQNEAFKLNSISYNNKLDEVEFNFNILNDKLRDYCNGFVDMIFRRGDYYSIVDWKSDKLNDVFDSYSNIDSLKKHVDDSYSIQRVLYSYCLIKWLKLSLPDLTEQEIFEKHFGGVYYIFLRGCNENTGNGVYCQTWESWSDLEKSYNDIIKVKVGGNKK